MERRFLLTVFLCFLVIYLWQAFFVKPLPKPSAQSAASASTTAAKTSTNVGAVASGPGALPPPPPVVSPGAAPVVSGSAERDVRVETTDVIAVFTNRGGRLKSWRLKHYDDQQKQPLELVAAGLAGTAYPLPFSLHVADEAVTSTLNGALYTVAQTSDAATRTPVDLTFEYRDTAGLHAIKQFHLEPKSYLLGFRDTVTSGDSPLAPSIEWGPGLGDSEVSTRFGVPPRGLLSAGGKEQRLPPSSIAKQSVYEEDFKYAGIDDHYFMAVAFQPGRLKVEYQAVSIPAPAGSKNARSLMVYTIDPGARTQAMRFYVGPKAFDELAAIDPEFVRAVDFGILSVIVVPLLRSLNWINGYVHNYGWSIVLLTVIINVIIFPLRHKSVVSMRKMQEIQPEAKAIQDRYAKLKATDPAKQKMNTELMELYKQRGVNPASGCVPMLLPFPILIAFYSLLSTAIELRGAPFALWIHDLSAPDPYYILPIAMGISQLWQTWIMPSAGVDPMQRKIGLITPVVFVFLFLSYPSGTALYWFSSTAWGIGQQYFTNYWIGPPAVHTVRPAAERRAKRVGSGKTDASAREES